MASPETPKYRPRPIDTTRVALTADVIALTELLAEHTHDVWALERYSQGWSYGPERDDDGKKHPCLVAYSELPDDEKELDRATALGTLKAILALGYGFVKGPAADGPVEPAGMAPYNHAGRERESPRDSARRRSPNSPQPRPPRREVQPVQVTVSARHGHLDDPTQLMLQEKAETLLRFFDRLTSIGVTVDLHRDHTDRVGVEILAKAEHKHEFVAAERAADVPAAFLLAADKVKQQIKHYKEKLQDHRRDPSHNDVGEK